MNDNYQNQVSDLLNRLQTGEMAHEEAIDQLFTLVYGELHSMATGFMHQESRDNSLHATDLVHEAYLRLVREESASWENRAHFFGVAARAMRQILVDHARKKHANKRGGDWKRITLTDNMGLNQPMDERILDLDEALTRFSKEDDRMAQIAELRIFGGLKIREVAHVLGVSRSTVQGDWRVAKMWLSRELTENKATGGTA